MFKHRNDADLLLMRICQYKLAKKIFVQQLSIEGLFSKVWQILTHEKKKNFRLGGMTMILFN